MPVYVYQCETCESVEEITQKISDLDKVKIFCAECWQISHLRSPMRRLISNPTVIFKGKGFYSTDNPKQEKIPRKAKESEWH